MRDLTMTSLVQLAFRLLGVTRSTLGFAERTDWSVAVDKLMARQTFLKNTQKNAL